MPWGWPGGGGDASSPRGSSCWWCNSCCGRSQRTGRDGTSGDTGSRDGWFRRFREQRCAVWRPSPSLPYAVGVLVAAGAALAALAVPLLVASLRVVELRARYDSVGPGLEGADRLQQQRALWDADARNVPLPAVLTLVVPPHGRPMGPPVYLLYEITGLYGTHKRYVRSVSWEQLSGGRPGPDALDACRPARYLGREDVPNASLPDSGLVDPCGLRAHSLFNDSFTLEADPDTCGLDKEAGAGGGSAVGSGAGGGAPAGSRRALASESAAAAAGGGGSGGGTAFLPLPLDESAAFWPGGTHRLYGAPYNATNLNPAGAEYGPLRGGGGLSRPVGQDPRLEAWMRPSASPTALKIYATVNRQLPPGCVLRLRVANRYSASYGWGGRKSAVLTSQSWYGMRNVVLPAVLLAGAGVCLAGALLLVVLGVMLPRPR